jgi:hypothetical protein
MNLLQWIGNNWGNLLLVVTLALLIVVISKGTQDTTLTTKAAPLTERQKAWKHWQQYWSFHEPYEDAWPHKDVENYLYYIKDPRTNLCFAVATPFGPSGFMASVPCNDKVQDQLETR